jgi:mono/diheme cytochrome c family protein
MKKVTFLFLLGFAITIFVIACGSSATDGSEAAVTQPTEASTSESSSASSNSATSGATSTAAYDPKRGEGKFHDVQLADKLDAAMATKGEKVYELKCASCHKLTEEKLVGPGWAGVTKRHLPEWILNFVTNTDEMLDKDPKAQAMLEICMVRMPNQNLSDDDARNLLEFMRKNDGVK